MSSITTLTSLSMLKVNIDQDRDYLEYLRPFVLQVLWDHRPERVTSETVAEHIRSDYGLAMPARAVYIVLKRIARVGMLRLAMGVYEITDQLKDPGLAARGAEASRHIQAVVAGLQHFYRAKHAAEISADEAVDALCEFLSEFGVPCLRAYLRGTTIPDIGTSRPTNIVLISQYVMHLYSEEPERFSSLMVLVQGHMLANGLLCPDLQNAPKSYRGVTFFFDTPLLLQILGLEGGPKKHAAEELLALLRRLDGKIAVFTHTRRELRGVIEGAANHIDRRDGRGSVVTEARKNGVTKSDLLLLAEQVDDLLVQSGLAIIDTPPYVAPLQIDENVFGTALADEIAYYNPRALDDDINSVRSIYVLRQGQTPASLERCVAVLVTSNSGFARAAWEYGKEHQASREVSSVISDFSLANVAWLKTPMGSPILPKVEVLAYSYAALQPSRALLDRYLSEIDKLQTRGTIGPRELQLLRSYVAQDELMNLTLGDEASLNSEAVMETLARITTEIKKEEHAQLEEEKKAHEMTQTKLTESQVEKQKLTERVFWQCRIRARNYAVGITIVICVFLLAGIASGIGLRSRNVVIGNVLWIGSSLLIGMSAFNLLLGVTVQRVFDVLKDKLLTRFIRQECQATGVDVLDSDWAA